MVEIRAVDPVETRPLRQRVLRPHQSQTELAHPREAHAETGAFAAVVTDVVVGTALVFPEERPRSTGAASWRLLAIAVDPHHLRAGAGTALIEACLTHVRDRGGDEIWCHARTSAEPFYRATGFQSEGAEWLEPHTGPHVLMWRAV